jgi:hypothetical protein
MKKLLTITIFLCLSISTSAQDNQLTYDDLEKDIQQVFLNIEELQLENSKLKSEILILNSYLSSANRSIDSLRITVLDNSSAIKQTANQLGLQITTTEQNASRRIEAVDQLLSKNSLYGIIGFISAIFLSGILYLLLGKRQKSDKLDLIDELSRTKSSIEESLVKEFGKQTELMDSQLRLLEQQRTSLQATPNAEPDHSLALKLASEINLIERNINLMDSKTKGLKQLQASVGKLKDNLSANGYEMPELLGKPFNQGMRVIVATSIPDENLEKGQEIITKILIPQVNYNDKMIQTAQIEVSVGY